MVMEGLCDDVVPLVLQNLPQDFLVRCKSVCRRWLRMILDDPLLSGVRMPGIIIRAADGEPPYKTKLLSLAKKVALNVSLKLPGGDANIKIVASANGLLFCVRERFDRVIEEDCYVYNPCTSEYDVVPRPSKCHPKGARMLRMGLAFDPNDTLCSTGTASYTIVNAFEIQTGVHEMRKFGFEIYSSSCPGSWRICNHVADARHVYHPLRLLVCQTGALFHNSVLYWPLTSAYMLTFHLKSETSRWSAIPTYPLDPLEYAVPKCAGWLGEYQGQLVFVTITHPITGVYGELNFNEKSQSFPYMWQPSSISPRIDLIAELMKNTELAKLLGFSVRIRLYYNNTHIFHPVGLERRGDSDVVLLATPWGRTLGFDLKTRKFEILMDVLGPGMKGSTGCYLPHPYSVKPSCFPYSPTTKRLPSSTSNRQKPEMC